MRPDADRGDATIEAVIIVPVIVVLTLLVVQFALVWHGRHVAQAAAQTAARSAAAYQAQPAAGQAAGDAYLAAVAPNLLPRRTVTINRDPGGATAVVTADVLTVLPFGDFSIQEQATAPLEIFVSTA
ncbi:TadE/TadG family type IV pilus assembly protein [Nakamurella sp. GG22]